MKLLILKNIFIIKYIHPNRNKVDRIRTNGLDRTEVDRIDRMGPNWTEMDRLDRIGPMWTE